MGREREDGIAAVQERVQRRGGGPAGFTGGQRLLLLGWGCIIAAVYLCVSALAFFTVIGERRAFEESIRLRMTPGLVEADLNPPDAVPETGDFARVTLGMYLDEVGTISIRDSYWTPTFYIWFSWTGDRSLDPGGFFRLVDGTILKKELQSEHDGADGTHYQRFRVAARVTKFFNATRVPRDSHQLNIYVEDSRFGVSRLRYVPDPNTDVSSRVRIPGYAVSRSTAQVVKVHTYRSSFSDPSTGDHRASSFSSYIYGVNIARTGMGIYIKVFMGMFAGMALCLTSFKLRAADAGPRLSMVVGAYFGAVANSYLVSALIPSTGQFGLLEYVTFIGLFTIFFSLLATLASIHIWVVRGDQALSRGFDRVTLAVAGTAYVGINLVLPIVA